MGGVLIAVDCRSALMALLRLELGQGLRDGSAGRIDARNGGGLDMPRDGQEGSATAPHLAPFVHKSSLRIRTRLPRWLVSNFQCVTQWVVLPGNE